MATRRVMVGVVVGLLVLAAPGVAHADPEKEFRECIEEELEAAVANAAESGDPEAAVAEVEGLLEEEEFVSACELKENNPILPATNELIWGSLSFLVLFVVLAWKGYPAIKKLMNDRTARIQSDVDAAEKARTDAEATIATYEGKIAEARTEAAGILEEARRDADEYRLAKRQEADDEVTRLREQAQADVEASRSQALADLRSEVATIAVGAAEQVVGRNLDRQANEQLVEQFIDQVGAGSSS